MLNYTAKDGKTIFTWVFADFQHFFPAHGNIFSPVPDTAWDKGWTEFEAAIVEEYSFFRQGLRAAGREIFSPHPFPFGNGVFR